nr:uncharacterized protein LOC109746491 [Aegilops tauschii subsp. strangulata]
MVSWSESESTEGSTAQYISTSDSPVKIRATIDDPLFEGAADDLMVMCEHGNPGRKYVAFEGISTGRRFIACVTEKTYEKLVEDVNNLLDYKDSQPEVNQKNNAENISVSVESSMTKDAEIKKLKAVVDPLKQIHVAQATVIRNLKFNHLKEKEKMSSDKRTLEICYADLKKEKDDLKKEKD